MTEEIDILLMTHNHLGLTIECLDALYANTSVPFRLTIVDDSTDLTPTYIAHFKAEHPNIQFIRPKEKLTSANQIINIGLKNTHNPLVVNITNTTTVEPNWLEYALITMEQDSAIGIIGFKLLYPSGIIEHAGLTYTSQGIMNYGMHEPGHRYAWVGPVKGVGWALVLLRRECFPDLLEEDYYIGFIGWDDLDNCLQIKKRGWKVFYCGLGSAYHKARATLTDRTGYLESWEENRTRFIRRWGLTQ